MTKKKITAKKAVQKKKETEKWEKHDYFIRGGGIVAVIGIVLSSSSEGFTILPLITSLIIAGFLITTGFKKKKDFELEKERVEAEKKAEEERQKMFTGLGETPVEMADGTIEKIRNYCKLTDGEDCLVVDGGRTYHTHVGCFMNWKPEQRETFTGWKMITVEEATSRGMRKCSFCEEADNRPEETIEDFIGWLDE